MNDLVTWLRAQLDDDEAYARNAFGDHNQAEPEWTEIWSGAVQVGPHEDVVLTNDSQVSRHIARHDPARVLREVEAKRRIISEYERYAAERRRAMNGWETSREVSPIMLALALPYADRPGYREEWRP